MRLAAGCGHPATQVQRRWCAATGRCGHRPLRKTGKPHRSPRPAAHSEASAPAVARDGWESRQRPSPKYPSTPDNPSVSLRLTAPFTQGSLKDGGIRPFQPRLPGQRLAKRKARKEQLVKFSLCPIPSEFSTAYKVRRSGESPARAPVEAASTEQDRLEPRPAARQGASRARNCAAKSVFSFDGSTAVFFLGLTKKKMGVD